MGVQGLWQLIDATGKAVDLESLSGKVLAIDVSIWINQALKGMRDRDGNPIHNAHLSLLFNRICKLLYYRIKPVFVFDGAAPTIKKIALNQRKEKREENLERKDKINKKLLENLLKQHAIAASRSQSGDNIELPSLNSSFETDLFELRGESRMPETIDESSDSSDDNPLQEYVENLDQIDMESEQFRSLPYDMQHEILIELKEKEKRNSWKTIDKLPPVAEDFSSFQMDRLKKKSRINDRIELVRDELNKQGSAVIEKYGNSKLLSKRIVSEDDSHVYLVKGLNSKPEEKKEDEKIDYTNIDVFEMAKKHMETRRKALEKIEEEETSNIEKTRPKRIDTSGGDSQNVKQMTTIPSTEEKRIVEIPLEGTSEVKGPIKIKEVNETESKEAVKDDNKDSTEETNKPSTEDGKIKESVEEVCEMMKQKKPVEKDDTTTTIDAIIPSQIIATEQENSQIFTSSISTEMVKVTDSKKNSTLPEIEEIREMMSTDDRKKMIDSKEMDVDDKITGSPTSISSDDEDFEIVLDSIPADSEDERSELGSQFIKALNENEFNGVTEKQLDDLSEKLQAENRLLSKERGKMDRLAITLNEQMRVEAQELLKLFSLPYINSPGEAEAQCAFLDYEGLSHGTITDDSDIWLFGGQTVYKNFFNSDKYAEVYKFQDLHDTLCLLSGCDYSVGIENIGPVTSMEILVEFEGTGFEVLTNLKKWWENAQKTNDDSIYTKLKKKLKKFHFPDNFPSEVAYKSFMNPTIDVCKEQFHWGIADFDVLKEYASKKLGWSSIKADQLLLPVFKRRKEEHSNQLKITSFMPKSSSVVYMTERKRKIKSRRVKNALLKMNNKSAKKINTVNLSESSDSDN
ncbi:DgyrCDS7901 [Dimorphilus gyrociliatus]|uniref:DgyrCDS7901 n=1 Tax=Dimorphilus gyrociliatus TaxID=2664684 RepID=A0A7I8VUZ5_9ANNE|nr:DgyrCDS7901 [Dimorphilus gyrociliatus]